MHQIYQITNEVGRKEINASTFDLSPANYSVEVENLKKFSEDRREPQPVLKTREELRAVMGDDPFWTAAVQSLLKCGFWAIKEEVRV